MKIIDYLLIKSDISRVYLINNYLILFADPLFLFDHDLVTSLADSEQVELLNNAIKVAEYFINFKKSKETISMKFRVNSNIFSEVRKH